MGFLIGEIIAFLAGAALVGVLIGWALFGGKKTAPATAGGAKPEPPPNSADSAAMDALREQLTALQTERDGLHGKLTERDEKIAELRNHLDETSRYRVEMAESLNKERERIETLEATLRPRHHSTRAPHRRAARRRALAASPRASRCALAPY